MQPSTTTEPIPSDDERAAHERIGVSPRELRAMALLARARWSAAGLGERLAVSRQGAYKLLRRLHRWGFVRRGDDDGTHVYEMATEPVVIEREIIEHPGVARLFLCIRCEPAQRY